MAIQEPPLRLHRSPGGKSWYELGFHRPETLDRRIEALVANRPDDPIVFISDLRPSRTTASALLAKSERVAAGLWQLGLRAGDRIAVQLPNWEELLILYLGAMRIGVVSVPLSPAYGESEARFILENARARTLFSAASYRKNHYIDRSLTYKADRLLDNIVIVGDEISHPGTIRWPDFLAAGERARPERANNADALALIVYTSGTTSRPKGVRHTHNTIGAELESECHSGRNGPGLNFFPMAHLAGLIFSLEPLFIGGGVYILDHWDAALAARLVHGHRIVRSAGTPVHLVQLMDAARAEGLDLSSISSFLVGSMPVPTAVVKRATDMGIACCRAYGSTEHPTITRTFPSDDAEHRFLTDGRLLPGEQMRVLDENGHMLTEGHGEIVSCGPEMFVGYTDATLNDESFIDGWFRTGDIASLDSNKYLTIVGRQKDIIIRGGQNISASEVEDALCEHPAIREASVVGMPDPTLGERVVAFITADPDTNLGIPALIAHFQRLGLAIYKVPERLVVVDALPRTSLQKVKKAELKSYLAGEMTSMTRLLDTGDVTSAAKQATRSSLTAGA